MNPTPGLAAQARLAARLCWPGATLAAAAGFLLGLLLPIRDWWLAGAAAVGCIALAFALFAVGGRRPASGRPDATPAARLEALGTPLQFGHAFARAGLILAGLCTGLALATLGGGRA